MLKPQGKFCIVAQPPGKLSISLGLLYDYSQRTIFGNYTGSRRDMTNMIAFSAQHDIESLVEVIPFSEMNEAIEKVRSGSPIRLVLENT
jgi:D-arabinose 1-dehydrogenase-like Zn-dependent alcohol dehydrogenase